jgi:hypothetical protein
VSRVLSQTDLGKITDTNKFMQYCSKLLNDLMSVFNGKIEFDLNILSQTVSVKFVNANTDLSVAHNLNKTGVKYIVASKSATCDVYNGVTSSTTKTIYLRSTVATTVTLILF